MTTEIRDVPTMGPQPVIVVGMLVVLCSIVNFSMLNVVYLITVISLCLKYHFKMKREKLKEEKLFN